MKLTVRGVRSVDIEMGEPERAAKFYSKIWNLTEVERNGSSIWFRGTGPWHHILAIHQARGPAALRRLTFDAANRDIVKALHNKVAASGCTTEEPHEIDGPGGGYGFGFADVENRMVAAIDAGRVEQLLDDLAAFASALGQESGQGASDTGAQDDSPQ